jgi:hypothetical protein
MKKTKEIKYEIKKVGKDMFELYITDNLGNTDLYGTYATEEQAIGGAKPYIRYYENRQKNGSNQA